MHEDGWQFSVYVLEDARGKFYVGQTDDLTRRLADHHSPSRPGTKFTTRSNAWRLVWSEVHSTRASAMQRERQIKSMKSARWIRENLLNR
jgi:predicted GIY-YIG superfamily endonuclease